MTNERPTASRDHPRTKAFIEDIIQVYERHGMALGHEDGHGAFLVCACDTWLIDWLRAAGIEPESFGGPNLDEPKQLPPRKDEENES